VLTNSAIAGSLLVQSGGTLTPGGSIGVLTCSNDVTLQSGSTNFFELNKISGTNDQLRVSGALNYGGTLFVTNLSGTLAGSDRFQLFSAANFSGNFSVLAGSPGAGLDWKFNPTNGVLTVYSTVPANLTVAVTNAVLQISWPADHLGWMLQVQTNDLSAGLGTNWISIPGSTTNTQFVAPLVPENPSVFYRLIYQ
jgi:fibronectin-binding autotransporter adhesin